MEYQSGKKGAQADKVQARIEEAVGSSERDMRAGLSLLESQLLASQTRAEMSREDADKLREQMARRGVWEEEVVGKGVRRGRQGDGQEEEGKTKMRRVVDEEEDEEE